MTLLRQFQFRPVLTIFTALSLAILLSLGTWQLRRLEWKRDLIAAVEAREASAPIPLDDALAGLAAREAMEYQPVFVEGLIEAEKEVRVFGTYDGAAGNWFFAPMTIAGGRVVYVNRGFAPLATPAEEVEEPGAAPRQATGLLRLAENPHPPESWFRPVVPDADGTWYVRDPALMAEAAGIEDVLPVYIDEFAAPDARWPKGGLTRTDFRNKHLEYALTWFGLAGALVAVWLAFSLQPRR